MVHKRYVYLLKTDDNRYKIGVSVNVERRIKQLQTGCSDKIMIVDKFWYFWYNLSNYYEVDQEYKEYEISGNRDILCKDLEVYKVEL